MSIDQMVPADHRVRCVWAYVQSLDLTPLYGKIRAVEGEAGRDATDPVILMTLWMYATIEGISSARQLARLAKRDWVYQWICGGVGVNHHLLSDFRTGHAKFLDQLLTDTIATLMHQDIVTLETVAQDGMRVRANAGSSSFRREKTLQQCRDAAAAQVKKLREESEADRDSDHGGSNARRQAAQERASRERADRVEAALKNLEELQQQKEKRQKGSGVQARSSTTDPEARVMKMGDGGSRPAYNVQFATDGKTRIIVGVDVSNNGSDGGQMSPMHETVSQRYGRAPGDYVVDGGFTTIADVTKVERSGSRVIGPIPRANELLKKGKDPHERGRKDTDEMAAFRQRMATDEAKELQKLRPSIAEFPNAECRNHGLHQFPVRGLEKVKAVALWHAITFNFMRMLNLELV